MPIPGARRDIEVLIRMLRQVEIRLGIERVWNPRRRTFVFLSSCCCGLLLCLLGRVLLRLLRWLLLGRRELQRRDGHVLRDGLGVEVEALLELHALLLLMGLLLLGLLLSLGLLLELLLAAFFFLMCCGVSLRELGGRGFFRPAPFLFQFFVHEPDPPAGFLVDLLEDPHHFFLLPAGREDFASVG